MHNVEQLEVCIVYICIVYMYVHTQANGNLGGVIVLINGQLDLVRLHLLVPGGLALLHSEAEGGYFPVYEQHMYIHLRRPDTIPSLLMRSKIAHAQVSLVRVWKAPPSKRK